MKKVLYLFSVLVLAGWQILAVPILASAAGPQCDNTGNPIAVMTATDTTVMTGSSVQFNASNSQGCGDNITSYSWNFGDGAMSSEVSPTHIFASAGSWKIALTVTDELNLINTTSITIVARDSNSTPSAMSDAYTFVGSVSGNITANDSDPEGDALQVQTISQPAHGDLQISLSGDFTYIASPGFLGEDSFSYKLTDAFGAESTADVTLTSQRSNLAPVATDDTSTTLEDTATNIQPLQNDIDNDEDNLQLTILSSNSGTAIVNSDQSITYTPSPNYNGQAVVDYRIDDGFGGYDFGKVFVTITPVNDAPVAGDDSATLTEDSSIYIHTGTNDSDVEFGVLAHSIVTNPGHGSLQDAGAGVYRYTPVTNFNGTDSFTYKVTDADGATAIATVNIIVTPGYDAVVAQPDAFSGTEDQQIIGSVTANDTYEAGPLTATLRTAPTKGHVVINSDGTFLYTPQANATGVDNFSYTVTDSHGSSSWQTVSLTIAAANDGPIANFTQTVDRRTVSFANLSSDIDGDSLSYHWNFGDGTTATTANPVHNYSKRGNYTITLTVTDNSGATATFTRTLAL